MPEVLPQAFLSLPVTSSIRLFEILQLCIPATDHARVPQYFLGELHLVRPLSPSVKLLIVLDRAGESIAARERLLSKHAIPALKGNHAPDIGVTGLWLLSLLLRQIAKH